MPGTVSVCHEACIINLETKESIINVRHNGLIRVLGYSADEKDLQIVYRDKRALFKCYDNYTLDQILFKKITSLWLCAEKPDKDIDNVDKLLKEISIKFLLSKNELDNAWNSFPENMQSALWRTIYYKI